MNVRATDPTRPRRRQAKKRPARWPPELAWAAALDELITGNLIASCVVRDGRIEHANEGLASLFGYDVRELPGRMKLVDLAIDADARAVSESLRKATAVQGGTSRLEFTGLKKGGDVVVVEMRARCVELRGGHAAVLAMVDVTERSHAFNRLRDLAFYDPLTDLPNRALFFDRLRQPVAAAKRSGESVAVLMADLDGFKAINDAHGHQSGDLVLKAVAQRLAACSRETDTVARIGGDEFAAILPGVGGRDRAAAVAERMIQALRAPFRLGARDHAVSASIGIALCPDDSTNMDHLLALADAAMYESKARGKSRFTFAQPGALPPIGSVLVTWTDAFLVGVTSIDGQHRQLVELANGLGDDLREGRDAATIAASMRKLFEHAALHFRTEEGLMDAYDVPDTGRHRQEHSVLLSDLDSLGANLESTSVMIALQHLKAWLIRHVDSLDRALAAELRSRGCS
jgi:diguanylate cyclase (GGDEF)-like protein/hemerythrin-like metal-binding protein/PAS domain S-box-containing protein